MSEDFETPGPGHPAFGKLMEKFEAAAVPMRFMIAPELAEWLDRWQVSYEGQPQPEGLDEYRDCTISEKLHFLILMEKISCKREHRARNAWRKDLPPEPEEP